MSNVSKYLLILESLQFPEENELATGHVESNLEVLRRYIVKNLSEIVKELGFPENADNHLSSDPEWTYCIYMYHVLWVLIEEINFSSNAKEDLISTRHRNCCIQAVKNVAVYGLQLNLHPIFKSHGVFAEENARNPCKFNRLNISLEMFDKIVRVKEFHVAASLNLVVRHYIAGLFTLLAGDLLGEYPLTDGQRQETQTKLDFLWSDVSKCEYFRNILFLKGIPKLPVLLQKRLHHELMGKLMRAEGFKNFVATLLSTVGKPKDDRPQSHYFEIVANVVAHKGHNMRFHQNLIVQIFKFLNLCMADKSMLDHMGAGLLTLKRLYELRPENRGIIAQKLDDILLKLTAPQDVLSGLIVMDNNELTMLTNFIFTSFCTSSMECLPSDLLICYLPLMLNVYSRMPDSFIEKTRIRSVIVRCLHNLSRDDLDDIVQKIVSRNYPAQWKDLHPRIVMVPNQHFTELSVKIGSPDASDEVSISNELPEILIKSEHNILTYNVFICLLKMMQTALLEDSVEETKADLMQSEQELMTFLSAKYSLKVEIILCLSALVTHQPLKAQIAENSKEFLNFLHSFIESRSTQSHSCRESTDHTLLLLLTITQEMIENTEVVEKYRDFCKVLRKLQHQTPNQLVLHRVKKLLTLLEGDIKASFENRNSQYNVARNLMKEKESHLKVYGINLMIDLLQRRDSDALSNGHVTIALALHSLKETESYTFLNCVRLFVALVNSMEAEVLETLCDEYLNENVAIDYRLVVGEAILKVNKELGILSYKYKDISINCFMHGSRSPLNEFRWSSFSNLATLCRTLSFQVHLFFRELLSLIENELATGKYLPAKRAAVLVLSELLQGIENLSDFEECLLPIYRLLKSLESNEVCDEKIRLHASNGLHTLGEKCRELFFPEKKIEKEIKIFGINETTQKMRSGHILELN